MQKKENMIDKIKSLFFSIKKRFEIKQYRWRKFFTTLNIACVIVVGLISLFSITLEYYGDKFKLTKNKTTITLFGTVILSILFLFVLAAPIIAWLLNKYVKYDSYLIKYAKAEISDSFYRHLMKNNLKKKEEIQFNKIKDIDDGDDDIPTIYTLGNKPIQLLEDELKEILQELFEEFAEQKSKEFDFNVSIFCKIISKRFQHSKWYFDGHKKYYPTDIIFENREFVKENTAKSALWKYLENEDEDDYKMILDDKIKLHENLNNRRYTILSTVENNDILKGSVAYTKTWIGDKEKKTGIKLAFLITTKTEFSKIISKSQINSYRALSELLDQLIRVEFVKMNKVTIYNIYLHYLIKLNEKKRRQENYQNNKSKTQKHN